MAKQNKVMREVKPVQGLDPWNYQWAIRRLGEIRKTLNRQAITPEQADALRRELRLIDGELTACTIK